jgi:hypothetical protein
MRLAFVSAILFAFVAGAPAAVVTAPHVQVTYEGIDANQATSIAQTLSAAWKVYVDDFGFDMPQTVICTATVIAGQPARLFTDGKDHVILEIPSKDKLAPPAKTGTFNLYGMCHELGHVAMYRTLKERDWMSSAAAEGWAHYAGSVVVDAVYAAKGQDLWYEPYDYRADGTARLKKQLASANPSDVDQGAGQWMKLETLIGKKGFMKLFTGWQAADIDATKPGDTLGRILTKLFDDEKDALQEWWQVSQPIFVEKRQASNVAADRVAPAQLTGKPTKLALDDDSCEDKRSIGGGGHARTFETPDDGTWCVCAVWIYGGRYGMPQPPATLFDISLCEPNLKGISTWKKPYSAFPRGDMKWIRFDVPPTRVPKKFSICLNFRPTARNGVYVGIDNSTQGNSVVGTPGKEGRPFDQGDWMIRVELDQLKPAKP